MKEPTGRKHQQRKLFDLRYRSSERRRSYSWGAILLLLSVPLFSVFEERVLSAGRVTDVSMLPTLQPGEYYLINKFSYRLSPPQRGDVVVIRAPDNPKWFYIKRVVGLGGETLKIASGRVSINGKPLEEPYAKGETHPKLGPLQIPAGSLYLLGDNREESQDSRQFGPIPMEKIVGKIRPGRLFSLR